jgi:PIN domain nuclease of toxin-antitoxin system
MGSARLILLDTHIWLWYLSGSDYLSADKRLQLAPLPKVVSAISCWEVAKLVERKRLVLNMSVNDWMSQALGPSGINLLPLEPEIAVLSTQLPGAFHKDPADQIIVATSLLFDISLATDDDKILSYPRVKLLWRS